MSGVFLTDFGLAKATATGSRYTRTGETPGTPAYMSPEQAAGEGGTTPWGEARLTPASDVWSLGCVGYELLAGRPPFAGDQPAQVIAAVMTAEPIPLQGLPPAVRRLIAACLAKDPRHRYASAAAVAADARRLLTGGAPALAPRPPHGRRLAMALGAVALGIAALAVLGYRGPSGSGPAVPTVSPDALAARAREVAPRDPGAAARILREALVRAPTRHDLRLDLGLCLSRAGDEDGARAVLAAVPEGAPEFLRARFYRGWMTLARGRLDDESAADLALVAAGHGPAASLATATLAVVARRWDTVRAALRDAAGWEADLLRAYVEQDDPAGDVVLALRFYDAALTAGPALPYALANRGTLRLRQGDVAGSLADYEAALALAPDYPLALVGRAGRRREAGDAAGAWADLDAAIRARPGYAPSLHMRAAMRNDTGDASGALADVEAAVAADPTYAPSRESRGRIRWKAGDLRGARADFDAALAADPRNRPALRSRAGVRQAEGDLAGACADLDVLLADAPRDLAALRSRGTLRQELGDRAGAVADYTAALAEEPTDATTLANRAAVRAHLGELAAAREDIAAALVLDPRQPFALANRGTDRHVAGDLDGAVTDYEAALAAAPADWPYRATITRQLAAARAGRRFAPAPR